MDAEIIRVLGFTIMFVHGCLFVLNDDIKSGVWAILGALLMNYHP